MPLKEIERLAQALQRLAAAASEDATAPEVATIEESLALIERIREQVVQRDEDARFVGMILEHIPDMIFVKDAAELRFVRFNAAGERLLGRPREELLGRNDHDFFPRGEADSFTAKDREVLDRGELVDIPEEEIHTPEGLRYLHTKKIPVCDIDGTPEYLLGISEDVTARKLAREEAERANAERRRMQEELSLLLPSFPGAVWTTDTDLRIVTVAGERAPALGLDPDSVGSPLADRIPSAASAVAALHELEDLGRANYEFHHRERTYQVSVSPLAEHETGRIIWIALDVTERRRLDAEALRSRLERGQRLEQLGLLAGRIAHDFNNLLTVILGNTTLAARRLPADSPALDQLEGAMRTAEAAGELTQQLLAYSGRGTFKVAPVDLSDTVGRVGQLIRTSVSKKAILTFELPEGLPPVMGDASHIRQTVLNLVTNAADALGNLEGRISVTTGMQVADRELLSRAFVDDGLPEGEYVFLEVRDTGHGMDTETMTRIFDPFFSTKERGQGLGLAATLGFVRQHRGAIIVDSEPGKGTRFRVLMPASAERGRARGPTLAHEQRQGRVLVVDDEAAVREFASQALRDAGYEVVEAADGREALERLGRQDLPGIDVVVLDLAMPRMGGDEALREIRRRNPQAKVILCSGYSEPDAQARLGGANRAYFLPKPYRPDDLVTGVDTLLGRRVSPGGRSA